MRGNGKKRRTNDRLDHGGWHHDSAESRPPRGGIGQGGKDRGNREDNGTVTRTHGGLTFAQRAEAYRRGPTDAVHRRGWTASGNEAAADLPATRSTAFNSTTNLPGRLTAT